MATQTDSTTNGDKRLKPHQLSLGLGIGMGAFILLSGVLPQITHWHNKMKSTEPCSATFLGLSKLRFIP